MPAVQPEERDEVVAVPLAEFTRVQPDEAREEPLAAAGHGLPAGRMRRARA